MDIGEQGYDSTCTENPEFSRVLPPIRGLHTELAEDNSGHFEGKGRK